METGFITRPEGKLAYTDYGGNGNLVLMLPGMAALRSEYRFLGPRLREAGFHPVSIDLRGHGDSSVPWPSYDIRAVGSDILAAIEHFGSKSAHVIGTSFSPGAIVWAAAEKPEAFQSIVLIGPFVRDPKINPLKKLGFWFMLNSPWHVRAWIRYYQQLYPTDQPNDFEEYLNTLRDNLLEDGRFKAAKKMALSSREASESRLSQVKTPALVVMGSKDPDFSDPTAEADFIVEKLGAERAIIEGAGHYPQTEMPNRVTPIIIDFLHRSSA